MKWPYSTGILPKPPSRARKENTHLASISARSTMKPAGAGLVDPNPRSNALIPGRRLRDIILLCSEIEQTPFWMPVHGYTTRWGSITAASSDDDRQ